MPSRYVICIKKVPSLILSWGTAYITVIVFVLFLFSVILIRLRYCKIWFFNYCRNLIRLHFSSGRYVWNLVRAQPIKVIFFIFLCCSIKSVISKICVPITSSFHSRPKKRYPSDHPTLTATVHRYSQSLHINLWQFSTYLVDLQPFIIILSSHLASNYLLSW